jgi:fructose-bisphosphate aldolase class II
MPVVPIAELVERAADTGTSVAAFNAITIEHAEGIVAGAERAGLPVILQLSENAIIYHGGARAIAAATVELARASSADVALHLDHITDLALLRLAPDLGYSSVMYDGSRHDIERNVELTRQAAAWGKSVGIWVEAELGEVGGKDGAHAPGVRTDPDEAVRFVADTGVDALAVAVGSSHAMVDKSAALDLGLIRRLHAVVPVPLVLHGSSGVPDDVLAEAARSGMVKINIGTALNVAYTAAIRTWISENPMGVDPRKYTAGARESVTAVVAHYLRLVAGRASDRPSPTT